MPKQRLDHADVDVFFDQERRGRVPEPVRGQMRFDTEAFRQRSQPLPERCRAEPPSDRVQEQWRRCISMFGTYLTEVLKLFLQLPVWHEDDPFFAALALHEYLASVRRHIADLQIREFTDPQTCDDQQLDDQGRNGILRVRYSVVRARARPRIDCVAIGSKNRFERVALNGARQAPRDLHRDADVGERGGQGAVPLCAPGIVGLEGHETPFDGRGLGAQLVAQTAVVGEDIFLRQRIGKPVRFGKARKGAQILRVGPKRVMSETAFVAARVDKGGVIEMGHAELLWLSSASSAQAVRGAKITRQSGNDNGTQYCPNLEFA